MAVFIAEFAVEEEECKLIGSALAWRRGRNAFAVARALQHDRLVADVFQFDQERGIFGTGESGFRFRRPCGLLLIGRRRHCDHSGLKAGVCSAPNAGRIVGHRGRLWADGEYETENNRHVLEDFHEQLNPNVELRGRNSTTFDAEGLSFVPEGGGISSTLSVKYASIYSKLPAKSLTSGFELQKVLQPLKTSMMTELPNWFKRVGPNDMILVYFSGHGFRDSAGKLYLAPLDCDPANAAATGVPVEWLREQIASCKARDKLLVLDACHAGSEKGEDDGPSVAAKDLGNEFENLAGVMTIASSEATEKSQIWDEKQQSLFSYWLNQALKGHADQNGDGVVEVHELYDFVYRNVTHTAQARFPRPQTPVRIVRPGIVSVPVVEQLQPQTLRQLLNDIADQLADNIADRKLEKVGVLEFTNDTPVGELTPMNGPKSDIRCKIRTSSSRSNSWSAARNANRYSRRSAKKGTNTGIAMCP